MDNASNVQKLPELLSAQNDGIRNMQDQFRCKITVLRKAFNEDFYQQYPYGEASPCGRLEAGQEFISNNRWDPPEGFCQWAWGDLRPIIQSIHAGHPATMIACCTDGLRPVTFMLEGIEVE
jgi:uncharacterized repeat protein (TIGR04076 family)